MKLTAYTCVLSLLACIVTPQAGDGGCPNYSQFTQTINIPYSLKYGHNYGIDLTVKGGPGYADVPVTNVGLDTGSTTFALGSKFVSAWKDVNTGSLPPGYVMFSNNRLWTGYFYKLTIELKGKSGDVMTSEVETLVVLKQYKECGWYKPENGLKCPPNPKDGQEPTEEFDNVKYMGLRFGILNRNRHWSGDTNALLHVTKFNGQVADKFRPGFVMRVDGIDVGLSSATTESFKCSELRKPDPSESVGDPGEFDWQEPPFSFQINDSEWCDSGLGLVDVGVFWMELGGSPCKAANRDAKDLIAAGTKVNIVYPSANAPFAKWSFTWPGPEPKRDDVEAPRGQWNGLPSSVTCSTRDVGTRCWGNLGIHFQDHFDILYDARGGYWGARQAERQFSISPDPQQQEEL